MITITSNVEVIVRVRLNQSNVNGSAITLVLDSPSRPQLSFNSVITTLSEGYYSFTLPSSDTSQLIDDTYLYTITQGEQSLKTGEVRRLLIVPIAGGFDYTLDFELA